MASLTTPVCEFGWKARDFNLLSADGSYWSPSKALGERGLVIMFICNHCPYVKAILDRLISDIDELKGIGVNAVAISSNDVENYPDDSYENMQKISSFNNFNFRHKLLILDDALMPEYFVICFFISDCGAFSLLETQIKSIGFCFNETNLRLYLLPIYNKYFIFDNE